MAIDFVSYFECIEPAILSPFTNDISQFLPGLSDRTPSAASESDRNWGKVNHVYYDEATSEINIQNAYFIEVMTGSIPVGESRYLFRFPIYTSESSDVPLCYFGAFVKCTSQGNARWEMGFFSDADLTTNAGVNSTYVNSTTTDTQSSFRIGCGYFIFPGRDDTHLYPNPWDHMGFALWYSNTGYNWTADYHRLSSQLSDQFGPYLYSDSGFAQNQIWFIDFHEYSLNHQDAGPWKNWLNNISPEVGPESEPGGYDQGDDTPTFDDSSDTISLPDAPTLGVSNVGFVNVYKTGVNSLQNMGVELFPPLQYTAPTAITASDTTEAIINAFNQLVTVLANVPSFFDQMVANTLINYVIDCHVIPVTPQTGSTEYIKVGRKTLTTQATRLSSDYVTVSCGSISIGEYYANFADFIATSAKLYLPFVGFVPVQPEWFQRETLKVDYRFNVIDGSFAVYVRSGGKYVNNGDTSGTIVGQYGGNACIHLPITGVTYANMVSGLVGAGAGMAASAGTGNIAALATSAIGAAGAHGDIAQSNAYNASAAFLGCRYPFLMIERAVSNYARNYQHEIGIPANIYAKLGDVSGFVTMENVHVDEISGATSAEKEEIRRLLASGVIV